MALRLIALAFAIGITVGPFIGLALYARSQTEPVRMPWSAK